MDLSLVPYQPHNDDRHHGHHNRIQYKECMKNHAASLGRLANDGCGEFMPTPTLTCAACGCHRNFHRQELPGNQPTHHHHHRHLVHPPPLLLFKPSHHTPLPPRNDHDRRSETPEREEVSLDVGPSKSKRCRTKFTREQKERMLEFAERIGWRIQKHQEGMLNSFCNELGIRRNVLRVWMHNNKNAHRRRESASHSPVVSPPALPQQRAVVGV